MLFDATCRDDLFDAVLWQRAMIEVALPPPGQYNNLRIIREQAASGMLFGRPYSLQQPVEWIKLYDGELLWMSDTPQERLMMLQGTQGMYGHVLVAGGGLGLFVQFLRQYSQVEQITIVERHPVIAAILRQLFASDPRVSIAEMEFDSFIFSPTRAWFDCCYIDIHPTLDPLWLPSLNWLRDQCTAIIRGPLRIWGYAWMSDLLVEGVLREYIPLLRNGHNYDTSLGQQLQSLLPARWREWSEAQLVAWLGLFSQRVAWPGAWNQWYSPRVAA